MEPKNIIGLNHAVDSVKQHPYRTGVVYDAQIVLDRRMEPVKKFEEELAKEAGASMDNHTVYEIISDGGHSILYVMCSDFKMLIGTKFRKERW